MFLRNDCLLSADHTTLYPRTDVRASNPALCISSSTINGALTVPDYVALNVMISEQ
jgi:hypothetical protein